MTREENVEMEAGRELDKAVAIHVMGCKCYYPAVLGANTSLPGSTKLVSLPEYSSDISAAWEVVEKLREKKLFVYVETYIGSYYARVKTAGQPREVGYSLECENVAEAICKASLMAVVNP